MYRIYYKLDPSTPSPQSKDDITIEIKYIENDKLLTDRDFSQLNISRNRLPEDVRSKWSVISAEIDGKVWFDPSHQMHGLTPFFAKVTNNTNHILRMGDARIYLVIDEENYPALNKDEIIENLATNEWGVVGEKVIRKSKVKLMNDLRMEVMPRQSAKGFMFFGVPPDQALDGTLSFFDVTTEVDAAGRPTKKTEFQFKIIQHKEEVVAK
ncbi:MAG: hypothetical protein IIA61_14710 [Candidatus Marinimicrobia bacterium]|nr:hypothetical protein [Candidatus Neomarinimicrobiota bacterium]